MVKAGCGIEHTSDGIAVNVNPNSIVCSTLTDFNGAIEVNPGCGIALTPDGVGANVANVDTFEDNGSSETNVNLPDAGDSRDINNTVQIDLRDWCAPNDATPDVSVMVNTEFFFGITGSADGWDATVTALRGIDGATPTNRGTLWTDDNHAAGTFGSRHMVSDVLTLTGGSVHTVTYVMRITNNSNVDIEVVNRQVITNALAITRAPA